MAAYRRRADLKNHLRADSLDQLRAQGSVTSTGELYLFMVQSVGFYFSGHSVHIYIYRRSFVWPMCDWLLPDKQSWLRPAVFSMWLQPASSDRPAAVRPSDRRLSQLSSWNHWTTLRVVRPTRCRRQPMSDLWVRILGTRCRRMSWFVSASCLHCHRWIYIVNRKNVPLYFRL